MSFHYRLSIKIKVPARRLRRLSQGFASLALTKSEWARMERVKDAMWDLRFEINGDWWILHKIEDVGSNTPTLILK